MIKIEYPNQEANVLSASEKQVVTKFNQLKMEVADGKKYLTDTCVISDVAWGDADTLRPH